MKWIGQHIVDFIARFRSDVYLEDVSDGTVADNKFLGLDSNNKVVKEAASATVTDLHSAGVDGAANQLLTDDGDGTITSEANATYDGADLTLTSGTSAKPVLTLKNTNTTGTSNSELKFLKDAADVAGGEFLGSIGWYGDNDNASPETIQYAQILSRITSVTDGSERGNLYLNVAEYDGTLTTGLRLEGQDQDGEVDVNIAAGAASTTTVAGTLTMGSTAFANNSGVVQVATQGTIDHDSLANFVAAEHYDWSSDISATATINPANLLTGDLLLLNSTTGGRPGIRLSNSNVDANPPYFWFMKTATGADDDGLGHIEFKGYDEGDGLHSFAKIHGEIADATPGEEAGRLSLQVAEFDGTITTGLLLNGDTNADGEVDVTIGSGAASTTTIAGDLTVSGGDIYGKTDDDLRLRSDDDIALVLDSDNDGTSTVKVVNGASTNVVIIAENGNIYTAGEIDLGHLNDTTIARSTAGVVTIEGNEIVTDEAKNVISTGNRPIAMHVARRTITQAEANAMNSTPIELVPAQGANTIIEVMNVVARVDRAANQTNGSMSMNAHYADKEPGTYGSASLAHFRRFAYGETTDFVERRVVSQATSGLTLTEDVNKAVEVSFDAAATNNCFTSIDMYITYFVIDIS